ILLPELNAASASNCRQGRPPCTRRVDHIAPTSDKTPGDFLYVLVGQRRRPEADTLVRVTTRVSEFSEPLRQRLVQFDAVTQGLRKPNNRHAGFAISLGEQKVPRGHPILQAVSDHREEIGKPILAL